MEAQNDKTTENVAPAVGCGGGLARPVAGQKERDALVLFVGREMKVSGDVARRLCGMVCDVFRIVDDYYDGREAEDIAALFEEYARLRAPEIVGHERE